MNRKNIIALLFAVVVVVAIPAVVHALFQGPYVVNPEGYHRPFWIGPVSTTIPYVILAVLFLGHSFLFKSQSRKSPYLGAIMAWLGMMFFTVYLICQTPGPELSSTMGMAVVLTPFFYIPFLLVPYVVGSAIGMIVEQRKTTALSGIKPAGGDA